MFKDLSRNRPLREWLEQRLKTHTEFLLKNADMVQLHRAQGAALLLTEILQATDTK